MRIRRIFISDAGFSDSQADIDEPFWIAVCVGTRAGDAGRGQGNVAGVELLRALRHGLRRFCGDNAVAGDHFRRHAEHALLGLGGVGAGAAAHIVGGAGNIGEGFDNGAAGAAFCCGDGPAALSEERADLARKRGQPVAGKQIEVAVEGVPEGEGALPVRHGDEMQAVVQPRVVGVGIFWQRALRMIDRHAEIFQYLAQILAIKGFTNGDNRFTIDVIRVFIEPGCKTALRVVGSDGGDGVGMHVGVEDVIQAATAAAIQKAAAAAVVEIWQKINERSVSHDNFTPF